TDKDGLLLGLLAAEIKARTGLDPAQYFYHLSAILGRPHYRRLDAKATPEQKKLLRQVNADAVILKELAGEPVRAVTTRDPENGTPIGGLKVTSPNGWFAARPSGTENIIKLYAESLDSEEHLRRIVREARDVIGHLSGDMTLGLEEEGTVDADQAHDRTEEDRRRG
ncbi:MAG TPA: alpha-D-glucose phosphate-specific phosphoglucomutase, partial [Verrucomicrobiota bacterium]|nr:alpha-D-glucose phosphate-specific phosphoglucomutase [Verrucomicrobiota bacterium]